MRLRELVGETQVAMVLQLTPVKLPARDLVGLAPGKILLSRYELPELCVGGLPMARAHPVRTAEHRGAQIAAPKIDDRVQGSLAAHA